jgi:hypothetical protein
MRILFIKDKDGDTADNVLIRILSYSEAYVRNNHIMPEQVKLSPKSLAMIKATKKEVIENNKILGMEIITQ